jgi:hypothetical protein
VARAPHDGWVSVALAGGKACAVHATGRVGCWGDDAVARGSERLACSDPAWVSGVDDVASLTAGGGSAMCARTRSGETWCWGFGPWYLTGDGGTEGHAFVPTRAPHLDAFERVSMSMNLGVNHACGIDRVTHALTCWGYGPLGQVGRPDSSSTALAPAVVLPAVTSVAAGPMHTCAASADGRVLCWGYGEDGALGDGDIHARNCWTETAPHTGPGLPGHYRKCEGPEPVFPIPRLVAGIMGVTALAAGRGATCAVADGRLLCWGKGYGAKPVPMSIDRPVVDVVGDDEMFCARDREAGVHCFGDDSRGPRREPARVAAFDRATSIAASRGRACAVVEGGRIRCSGRSAAGLPIDDWTGNAP